MEISLSIERFLPSKTFRIFLIPFKIIANFLDNILFSGNKNNTSIAIVAEKFKNNF